MTYDWESRIDDDLIDQVSQVVFAATGLTLAGLAVANMETGEAALVECETGERSDFIEADYRQDILSDADAQYSKAEDYSKQVFEQMREASTWQAQ